MPTVAEAQELFAFVSKYRLDDNLQDDPRLFAALSAWCYATPGRPDLGAWNRPGLGFIAFDGSANCPVPAPAASPSGYDAGAFYHPASRSLIIVNRGTEEWDDWDDNIQQYIDGRAGPQSNEALDFAVRAVRRVQRMEPLRTVVVTGHSLGGGLAAAQFCVLKQSLKAITAPEPEQLLGFTFGTAPFKDACLNLHRNRFPDAPQTDAFTLLQNWRRKDDPLSLLDRDRSRTLGTVVDDLPAVWTVIFQPDPAGTKGARNWKLRSGTVASHSAYLYFKYFDLKPSSHILLRRDGQHVAKPLPEPKGVRSFAKLPDWA